MPRKSIPKNEAPPFRGHVFPRPDWSVNTNKQMQPQAAVKVPLMEREVCDRCKHLHRAALARNKSCRCCLQDVAPRSAEFTEQEGVSL